MIFSSKEVREESWQAAHSPAETRTVATCICGDILGGSRMPMPIESCKILQPKCLSKKAQ